MSRVRTVCALSIAALWLFAGLWKVADLDAFRTVLRVHAVLPLWFIGIAWIVPAGEIVLGLAVGLVAGRTSCATKLIAAGSLLIVIILSTYIAIVPRAQLHQAGCGCHGAQLARIVSGLGDHDRFAALLSNGVFAALHLPLFWPLKRERFARRLG